MNKKIEKALKKGGLIDYDEVFDNYPKEKQERILERARYIKIAMELRRLRKQLKMTQEELSEKMGVKREFISRIESGKQNVTLDTLFKIADATDSDLHLNFA